MEIEAAAVVAEVGGEEGKEEAVHMEAVVAAVEALERVVAAAWAAVAWEMAAAERCCELSTCDIFRWPTEPAVAVAEALAAVQSYRKRRCRMRTRRMQRREEPMQAKGTRGGASRARVPVIQA